MEAERIILGEGAAYSTDSDETSLNNNVLVCGGTGSGKTMSYSEARLLETSQSSLIVTVTKRRIVEKYKPLFQQRGYQVEELNFIDPKNNTLGFDPLKHIKSHNDIVFLAESIVRSGARNQMFVGDDYWNKAAISLLSAEIAKTLMTKMNATFADVLKLHDRLNVENEEGRSSLDDEFEELAQKKPNCFAVSCFKSFSQLPVRTRGCVFGSLNTILDTMFTPELRKVIALPRTVDFKQRPRKKTVLFVSTSAVNKTLHCFVNIFYAQAFKSLFEFAQKQPDGKLPIPVHVLCDDFATGSPIQNFPEYLSVMRETGLSVSLLIQSESQLTGLYGASDAATIINNCDTYLYMGGMDLQTGRAISARLNEPLEDVLSMPLGQVCIFRRGQKPIKAPRYEIRKNSLYQQVTQQYEELQAMTKLR